MSEKISEILREFLIEERQKNPSVNETAISKKIDIPPTTFNRLLNGYSKKASLPTIIKLIQFIPELKKNLPEEVVKVFEVTMEKKTSEYMGQMLETLLSDKYLFICWALAFTRGVTEDEIRESFGGHGLSALETLEKKNIISKNERGRYRIKEPDKKMTFSFQLIRTHLLFLIEEYKPGNLKTNYIHYRIDYLNKKGGEQLMQAHKELHRKIQRIMSDEANKGDTPYFSTGCSDALLNIKPKEIE